jgi:hypothetical protein
MDAGFPRKTTAAVRVAKAWLPEPLRGFVQELRQKHGAIDPNDIVPAQHFFRAVE